MSFEEQIYKKAKIIRIYRQSDGLYWTDEEYLKELTPTLSPDSSQLLILIPKDDVLALWRQEQKRKYHPLTSLVATTMLKGEKCTVCGRIYDNFDDIQAKNLMKGYGDDIVCLNCFGNYLEKIDKERKQKLQTLLTELKEIKAHLDLDKKSGYWVGKDAYVIVCKLVEKFEEFLGEQKKCKICNELKRKKARCDLACWSFDSEGKHYYDFEKCTSPLKKLEEKKEAET